MCVRIFGHLSLISAEKITFLFSRSVVGVEDYESILTVQPATSSDQMGLEFALSGYLNIIFFFLRGSYNERVYR